MDRIYPRYFYPWKRGRVRVIDKIWFKHGDWSSSFYPIKWKVTLANPDGIIEGWQDREQKDTKYGQNILIELGKPTKVTHIFVTIIEPRQGQYWAVGDIEIREVRLFGRVYRKNIK